MTHEELQNQFILQNLKEGTPVQLTLIDGSSINGTLSTSSVFPETIINGETIGSRIGIFPGPLTVMQTHFSANIEAIISV